MLAKPGMRLLCAALVSVLLAASLAGCWDSESIEQLDYVKSFGLDYDNGEYIVYLQLPNLSTVAKKEGPAPELAAKAWIARGKGSSINAAVGEVYRTAPKRIVWGHTTVIVLSERLMESADLPEILGDLNRFRELRYTMWVFGTNASFEDLLSVSPTFEASRMYTILQNPMSNYKAESQVLPIRLHRFMNDFQDRARWAVIPAITVDTEQWEAGKKEHRMHKITGEYVLHQGEYKGYFPYESIKGTRWLEHATTNGDLRLSKEGQTAAVLRIHAPQYEVEPVWQRSEPVAVKFNIKVQFKATLLELHESVRQEELIRLAKAQVEEEIRAAYAYGLKSDADLLQLSKHLYSKAPKTYNRLTNDGEKLLLTKDSLGQVEIELKLEFLGKYKFVK